MDNELKYIELVVKKKLSQKRLYMKELANFLELTETGLNYTFKKDSLKVTTLVKIASFLKMDVASFFDYQYVNRYLNADNNSSIINESMVNCGNDASGEALKAEIASLKEMIKAKDSIIESKDEIIALLKK